jgi:putative FmdB family regulatory protein
MPTYVYGCDACGQQFEKFQKFSDQPVRECPNCGHTVRRIIQPAGIVFKGSGWHVTDYKRGGKGASSDATAGEASTNGDAAPAKTDTKPDATPAKSDTKPDTKSSTASGAAA